MNPNDNTMYGGMPVENEENPQVMNEKEGKKEVPWKFIGLGTATGILMGAGALYASDAMASVPSDTPEASAGAKEATGPVQAPTTVPIAKDVAGDSFEHAFAEARAQVGPGGVFHWHGGIYNTFTKEEWDAMSDADKKAFAAKIHPQHDLSHVDTDHITVKDPYIHIDTVEIHEHTHEHKTIIHETADDDVHVVHYEGTDEVTIDGKDISVENYEVDGHKAAVLNFHDEDEHDIAIVDKNDNLQIDDAEAKDIVTGELLDSNLNPMSESDILAADNDIDANHITYSSEI